MTLNFDLGTPNPRIVFFVPDDVVLRWVGHSSLRVTDGYTHRSGDSLSAMAEKIGLSQVVPSPA